MSFTSGTFSSVTSPAVSSEAAIAGNAEFFAPLILTRPLRRGPPVILSLSIFPLSGLAGLPVKNQFPGHECLHDPESPVQNRNAGISMRECAHCVKRMDRIANAASGASTGLFERCIRMSHGRDDARVVGHMYDGVDSFQLRSDRYQPHRISRSADPLREKLGVRRQNTPGLVCSTLVSADKWPLQMNPKRPGAFFFNDTATTE